MRGYRVDVETPQNSEETLLYPQEQIDEEPQSRPLEVDIPWTKISRRPFVPSLTPGKPNRNQPYVIAHRLTPPYVLICDVLKLTVRS